MVKHIKIIFNIFKILVKGNYQSLGKFTPFLKSINSFLLRCVRYKFKILFLKKYYPISSNIYHLNNLDNLGYTVFKNLKLSEKFKFQISKKRNEIIKLSKTSNIPFNILDIKDNDENSEFLSFATSDWLKNLMSCYLRTPVILSRIEIWHSPNDKSLKGSSQNFHFDDQDDKSILFLIPLNEIDDDTGPFTLLNSNVSKNIIEKIYGKIGHLNSKRITDEEINAIDKTLIKSHSIRLTSNLGKGFLVDGDRCLHYGSRKALKSRTMLVFHYFREFYFHFHKPESLVIQKFK